MPDDREMSSSSGFCEAKDVGRKQVQVVCRDRMWPGTQIIAALVRHEDPEPGVRQGLDLVPPAVPELGKPVQQDDERTFRRSGVRDMEADAVRAAE